MLVITGNPGTGKHTLAAIMSDRLKQPLLDINEVVRRSGLIEDDGQVDTRRLGDILRDSLDESSIVVGHLAPYVLCGPDVTRAIILRKSPYELEAIYRQRGYSFDKMQQNLQSEIIGVISHDAHSTFGNATCFELDTTDKTPRRLGDISVLSLHNDIKQDTVDWLGLVSKRDDLRRFFSY